MPIQLTQQLKHVSKVVRLDGILSGNDKDWMAWWYCGIYKNRKADSQPNALVAFRELLNSNSLSDNIIYRLIPLTALGQVRVGTVWRHGQSSVAVLEPLREIRFLRMKYQSHNGHETIQLPWRGGAQQDC